MQIVALQIVQQRLLLFAPAVLHIDVIVAEQHFDLTDLHAVINPAFNLPNPVDIGVIKQAVPPVCSLGL